jgi:hypothetical protein
LFDVVSKAVIAHDEGLFSPFFSILGVLDRVGIIVMTVGCLFEDAFLDQVLEVIDFIRKLRWPCVGVHAQLIDFFFIALVFRYEAFDATALVLTRFDCFPNAFAFEPLILAISHGYVLDVKYHNDFLCRFRGRLLLLRGHALEVVIHAGHR